MFGFASTLNAARGRLPAAATPALVIKNCRRDVPLLTSC
jgi:hypothetical protein